MDTLIMKRMALNGLLAAGGAALLLGWAGCSADSKPYPAPSWQLKDLDGKTVNSSAFAGKVVILDFWATWCPPCRQEIPGFVSLQNKHGKDGLAVVGIALDEDGAEVVKTFAKKNGINYTVLLWNEKVVEDYGHIGSIPTTFIIDRQGTVIGKHVRFTSEAEFEREITPLLKPETKP
jgi:peroxiredoxin